MPYFPIRLRSQDFIAAREEAKVTELCVNGVRVVDVTLTDASHKLAAKYGIGIRKENNDKRAAGYGLKEVYKAKTQFDEAEYEVAAKEGELAASIYLTGNELAAMKQWVIGKGDSGDLALWAEGEVKIIDVKIRTQPYHCCFKLELEQWQNHCPDYYVVTQYPTTDREQVRILGFVERSKIDELVLDETKRLLSKSIEWTYEGTGIEKRVNLDSALTDLSKALKNSPELCHLNEAEVTLKGIGDLGWGRPVIAIPFKELNPIAKLRTIISS